MCQCKSQGIQLVDGLVWTMEDCLILMSSILVGMAEKQGWVETINQRAYAWPLLHGGLSIVRQGSDKKAQVSQREYSKKQDTEAASLSKPGTRNCHSVISTVLYQSNNQNPPRSYGWVIDSNLLPSCIHHSLHLETDASGDTHNSFCPIFHSQN